VRSFDPTPSCASSLAYGGLPAEGVEVRPGDVIGGAHELFELEAEPKGGSDVPDVSRLLDAWGCREGLPTVRTLKARLLDGSAWEIRLAERIEVIGAERASAYGDLYVDGEVVAGAGLVGQRPDFSRPEFPGFDPPVLMEEFTLADGRRAEHWNLAPSNENDTFMYVLWVEGPGEHVYFSSGRPIEEAELVVRSLRMVEAEGRIEAVWFASERVDIGDLQTVFFLMDPKAPPTGPEVRLNSTCRVGHDFVADCERVELEVPVYTPGTKRALQEATIVRIEP